MGLVEFSVTPSGMTESSSPTTFLSAEGRLCAGGSMVAPCGLRFGGLDSSTSDISSSTVSSSHQSVSTAHLSITLYRLHRECGL